MVCHILDATVQLTPLSPIRKKETSEKNRVPEISDALGRTAVACCRPPHIAHCSMRIYGSFVSRLKLHGGLESCMSAVQGSDYHYNYSRSQVKAPWLESCISAVQGFESL